MDERGAQLVLLARAFEEADAEGRLLPRAVREQATQQARAAGGDADAQAAARARQIVDAAVVRVPGLDRVASARFTLAIAPLVAALALIAGLVTNALGPREHVSVLAFPLLGLFAWNVLVYVGLLLWPRAPGREEAAAATRSFRTDAPPGTGIVLRLVERAARGVRTSEPELAGTTSRALGAFAASWRAAFTPLLGARVAVLLHLGAAALVVGAVIGMYVRGLTFEYRATWSSTFLDADGVAALLRVVLGPAAALLGEALTQARLAAMRAPADAPAAPWIHMYAIMAALIVVAPRLLLACGGMRRVARLREGLGAAVTGGAFRALGDISRGQGAQVLLAPYSYHPAPRALDALRGLAHDAFGLRADVLLAPALEYGGAVDRLRTQAMDFDAGPRHVVLVFGLTQSPEAEVHGRLVAELQLRLGPHDRLLCLVDASHWYERFGRDADARLDERRRAWDRVLQETGVSALHVDLSDASGAGAGRVLDGIAAALWPAGLLA